MSEVDEMNAVVRSVASKVKDAIVCDLGACDGGTARQMISWLPNQPKRFVLVEPDPRNVGMIRRANLPQYVEVYPLAIGGADGHGTLHLSDSDVQKGPGGIWSVSSTLRRPKETLTVFPHIVYRNDVTVRVRSLDSLCREIGIEGFDIIWCDIEGSEGDMIVGGSEVLSRSRFMFIEKWKEELYEGMSTRDSLLAMLPGWEIIGEWQYDIFLKNEAVVP